MWRERAVARNHIGVMKSELIIDIYVTSDAGKRILQFH